MKWGKSNPIIPDADLDRTAKASRYSLRVSRSGRLYQEIAEYILSSKLRTSMSSQASHRHRVSEPSAS